MVMVVIVGDLLTSLLQPLSESKIEKMDVTAKATVTNFFLNLISTSRLPW
jgi:hypothetical protein